MNKRIRVISILLVLAMLAGTQLCFASESVGLVFDVSWAGDYTDASKPKLKIEINSSAGYIHTIAVAMYDDDFDAMSEDNRPSITDYYRMKNIDVRKGETAVVAFGISDKGTPLDDGAYRLLLQSSGKDSAANRIQIPVWVINPSKISGIIGRFNDASASDVAELIGEVKNALQLELDEDEETIKFNTFINIRKYDYDDSFKTLHDIQKAWNISEIVAYLAGDNIDNEMLRDMFENNAAALGIDTASEDYKKYTSEVYDIIVYNNSLEKAKSVSDISTLFDEASAIVSINNATNKNISQKLESCYKALGISENDYKKLADCRDKELKSKIERMFMNKNFKTSQKVRDTFDEAVESYLSDNNGSSGSGSGNSGGSSGGGGGGSFVSAGKLDATVIGNAPAVNSAVQTFKDCPKEHWAYSYVESLKESNIISGYEDGTFKPDKTVNREEFVKMMILLAGLYNKDSVCEFEDVVEGEWYYPYVSSAYNCGIVNGISENKFGIGEQISRQDAAVIVHRLFAKLGAETESGDIKKFDDADTVADYAQSSVDILSRIGIINGFEDGSFRPLANITRAEAAKILSVVKDYINKQ